MIKLLFHQVSNSKVIQQKFAHRVSNSKVKKQKFLKIFIFSFQGNNSKMGIIKP